MNWAILELYSGESGKLGYYNSQELGLARALCKRGIHVTIVYPTKGLNDIENLEVETGITVLRVPCWRFGVHSFYNLKFLLERKIDVVHLDSDNQIYAPTVMKFCRRHGIFFYNYVGTIYSDTENFIKKHIMKVISYRNMKYFRKTLVIAKTESLKQSLIAQRVKKVKVIPVGLDLTQIHKTEKSKNVIRTSLGIPENMKVLLFVGRLENYKRPFAVLQMLEKLGKDYCFIVIGDGSLKTAFCKEIQRMNACDRVFYYRQIDNVEMFRYYCACDYYVNFNTHEIFGMSILEAMYQRCIVVARKAPGPKEIIEDKISGYLCDTDEEMIEVVKGTFKAEVGIHAEERILSHFTWERSAEEFLKLVKGRVGL